MEQWIRAKWPGHRKACSLWFAGIVWVFLLLGAGLVPPVHASQHGPEGNPRPDVRETSRVGYPVPGASFRVFMETGRDASPDGEMDKTQAEQAVQTVIEALTVLVHHRIDYPRVAEAMSTEALQRVIIESTVVNRDGKAFPFLVVRTTHPGRVNLLISASSLKEQGFLGHPEQLVPMLAREFQWVVSKAETTRKPTLVTAVRDLAQAPIRTNKEIGAMSEDERVQLLRDLFNSYLSTVDDRKSLKGQPFYEIGTTTLVPPTHPDSTIKLYEIRIRDALEQIVREPFYWEHTPKAVRSLLNGTIWTVAFVKIDQRDWATRTRVLPKDQAVVVGDWHHSIQPATILVNTYRMAVPEDPYYAETKGLPMGALAPDQLAHVIAWEIQHNITEKSMRGHVIQDSLTAPD